MRVGTGMAGIMWTMNGDDDDGDDDDDREKIEDYLRFLTHAGETRFPIFA